MTVAESESEPSVQPANVFERHRRAVHLRPVDVATLSGESRSLIHDLERGKRQDISARKLYRIAKVLGVRMETLLELPALGEDDPLDQDDPELHALAVAQIKYGWPAEDVRMLAQVHFRGRRPALPDDWWYVYEGIRRGVTHSI
jgi:transcriptional regulator with XRE-family HTH domain